MNLYYQQGFAHHNGAFHHATHTFPQAVTFFPQHIQTLAHPPVMTVSNTVARSFPVSTGKNDQSKTSGVIPTLQPQVQSPPVGQSEQEEIAMQLDERAHTYGTTPDTVHVVLLPGQSYSKTQMDQFKATSDRFVKGHTAETSQVFFEDADIHEPVDLGDPEKLRNQYKSFQKSSDPQPSNPAAIDNTESGDVDYMYGAELASRSPSPPSTRPRGTGGSDDIFRPYDPVSARNNVQGREGSAVPSEFKNQMASFTPAGTLPTSRSSFGHMHIDNVSGIGIKLMIKMGFIEGRGLGKHLQGLPTFPRHQGQMTAKGISYCKRNTKLGVVQCIACDKSFGTLDILLVHTLTRKHYRALANHSSHTRILNCTECYEAFEDLIELKKHFEKVKHTERPGGPKPQLQAPFRWHCDICNLDLCSESQFLAHINGKKHGKMLKKLNKERADKGLPPLKTDHLIPDEAPISFPPPNSSLNGPQCDLCGVRTSSVLQFSQHVGSRKHGRRFKQLSPQQQEKQKHFEQEITKGLVLKRKPHNQQNGNDKTEKSKPIGPQPNEFTCAICNVTMTSRGTYVSHIQGKRHKRKCDMLKLTPTVTGIFQDIGDMARKKQKKD